MTNTQDSNTEEHILYRVHTQVKKDGGNTNADILLMSLTILFKIEHRRILSHISSIFEH